MEQLSGKVEYQGALLGDTAEIPEQNLTKSNIGKRQVPELKNKRPSDELSQEIIQLNKLYVSNSSSGAGAGQKEVEMEIGKSIGNYNFSSTVPALSNRIYRFFYPLSQIIMNRRKENINFP